MIACLSILIATVMSISSTFPTNVTPFIDTLDGPYDLQRNVSPTNTFGAPQWYERVGSLPLQEDWRLEANGAVATNICKYWAKPHTFVGGPGPRPDMSRGSDWGIYYSIHDIYGDALLLYPLSSSARFPDQDMGSDLEIVSTPYENDVMFISNPFEPCTLECEVKYRTAGSNGTEVTRSATLFPESITYIPIEFYYGSDTKIWSPRIQRMGRESRAALLAAYEAYFERMYWASRGDTGEWEDTSEWEALGLASFEKLHTIVPGPGFLFNPADPTAGWCQGFPLKGFVDYDLRTPCRLTYPDSAFHFGFQNLRRSYPSGCMRTLDETEHIRRLCTGVRAMFPANATGLVASPGDMIPLDSRVERSFLCRPQWILDGRAITPEMADRYPPYSSPARLWWSTTLHPVCTGQLCENVDKIGSSGFTLDYLPTDGELGHVLLPVSPVMIDPRSMDDHDGIRGVKSFMRYFKPFLQTFTLDMFAAADGEFSPTGIPPYGQADDDKESPFCTALRWALDMAGGNLSGHFDDVARWYAHGYDLSLGSEPFGGGTQTVTGMIATNIVESFRSIPNVGACVGKIVDVFNGIECGSNSTMRIDSTALALCSQVLALADRTILFPTQTICFTNNPQEATSGGNYTWTPGGEYIEIPLEEAYESLGSKFTGLVVSQTTSESTTFTGTKTNDLTSIKPFVPSQAFTDLAVEAEATTPTDYTLMYPDVASDVSVVNPPDKAFEVGDILWNYDVTISGDVSPAYFLNGKYRVNGFLYGGVGPEHPLVEGLFCFIDNCYNYYESTYLFIPTKYPSGELPRIRAKIGADTPFDCKRTYRVTLPHLSDGGSVVTGAMYPSRGAPAGYATYGIGAVAAGFREGWENGTTLGVEACPAAVFVADGYTGEGGIAATKRAIDGILYDDVCGMATRALKEALLFDPEDPAEYAPVPSVFSLRETVWANAGDPFVFNIGPAPNYHVEAFPTGETIHEYRYEVVSYSEVGGYVEESCKTARTERVRCAASEIWVRQSDGGPYRLEYGNTSEVSRVIEPYPVDPERTVVYDGMTLSSVTSVVRRTVIDDGELKPFHCTVVSNALSITTYAATTHQELTLMVSRDYYHMEGTRRVYDKSTASTDVYHNDVPWVLPPTINSLVGTHTYEVILDKSQAEVHRSYPNLRRYEYEIELFVNNGVIEHIGFQPMELEARDEYGPDIDEVDRYHIAEVGLDEADAMEYIRTHRSFGSITPSPPAGEEGRCHVRIGLGVLNWADWNWNALKMEHNKKGVSNQ